MPIRDSDQSGDQPVIYPRSEHNISRSLVDPDALKIMYRLLRHGFKAYLVGGGVRDLLLNKQPKDFDIATDATPRQIKGLFRNSRIIGRRFKLVHIYFRSRKIIEVSTFRQADNKSNSTSNGQITRDNTYGDERSDAFRRDLTINALFYDLSTFAIIDYVGGVEDIEAGIIRIIGDPDIRFAEDPIRMHRAIRHAGRSGFELDEDCLESIRTNHHLLEETSEVRLYEEIKKDLCSGSFLPIVRLAAETDLLQHYLPELHDSSGQLLSRRSDLAHALERADELVRSSREVTHTVVLSILALFMSTGRYVLDTILDHYHRETELVEQLTGCFSKLAVPRKERERIESLLRLWFRVVTTPVESLKPNALTRRIQLEELLTLLKCVPPEDGAARIKAVNKARELRRGREEQGPSRSGKKRKHSGARGKQKGKRKLL